MSSARTSTPKKNTHTTLVVMGATGDLMGKKIIPSLQKLFEENRLPPTFHVIGFARKELTTEAFRALIRTHLKRTEHKDLDRFLELFQYVQGDFQKPEGFKRLAATLTGSGKKPRCPRRLFYMAVPPERYEDIFTNMAEAGLHRPCVGKGEGHSWTRVMVEKPFGLNRAEFRALERLIGRYFTEEQIYRIDHYLAKELMQGIMNFRFSNNLLEQAWDNSTIERIDVTLCETIGAENRGVFYDRVGALRDVGQNHVLLMLAAITMTEPKDWSAKTLRTNRAAVLKTLKPWTAARIKEHTERGQYDSYASIPGIKKGATTETYFRIQTELRHPHWKGVPITIEGGKRCPEPKKEITVHFKHPKTCLLCTPERHTKNKVRFSLTPNDQITIHFWTKKPGFENELEERRFSFFLYERRDPKQYTEEYARLLDAALTGNATLFVGRQEIDAMWKFVDPIIDAWQKNLVPLKKYAVGSPVHHHHSKAGEKHAHEPIDLHREIGIIGLGKMGGGIARQLLNKGWRVAGWNRSPESTEVLAKEGLIATTDIKDLVQVLAAPRVIWLMVPSGKPVDNVLAELLPHLQNGDTVIDGGNSFYKNTIKRAAAVTKKGIRFIDVGVSGGPEGARNGACLMVGGKRKEATRLSALFTDLAVPDGWQHFEGVGAGHFVKMVHNGIEYGMMQSIAEGFTLLKETPAYKLDLSRVADVYNHGSVIESRLIGWLEDAFQESTQALKGISGTVAHSGEGDWTIQIAKEQGTSAKVIEEALNFRKTPEQHPTYTGKILSALRGQFGGHPVSEKEPETGNT